MNVYCNNSRRSTYNKYLIATVIVIKLGRTFRLQFIGFYRPTFYRPTFYRPTFYRPTFC